MIEENFIKENLTYLRRSPKVGDESTLYTKKSKN